MVFEVVKEMDNIKSKKETMIFHNYKKVKRESSRYFKTSFKTFKINFNFAFVTLAFTEKLF